MIFDDFKNLGLYNIDPSVCDFILNLDKNVKAGRHEISENAYVNVDEYLTRDEIKLEAHKRHVDIQFLLDGEEKVYTTFLDNLNENVAYNHEKDIVFYDTPKRDLNVSYLTKGKFIILYPDDVHSPCSAMVAGKFERVKKVIVKIKIK